MDHSPFRERDLDRNAEEYIVDRIKEPRMLDANSLFASLFWGSVGIGYFIYGKRQQSASAVGGGLLMLVVSYFAGSASVMSLVCLGIVVAVYLLIKRGY